MGTGKQIPILQHLIGLRISCVYIHTRTMCGPARGKHASNYQQY